VASGIALLGRDCAAPAITAAIGAKVHAQAIAIARRVGHVTGYISRQVHEKFVLL
jgi:hypothetical protein